jgi:hypothetical protein
MGKISGRKDVIQIFSEHHTSCRKLCQTMLIRQQRSDGMNPFQLCRRSSKSTYGQKIELKRFEHLNMFLCEQSKSRTQVMSPNIDNQMMATSNYNCSPSVSLLKSM